MVCLFDYSTFICISAVSRLDWVIRVIGFNHDSSMLAAGSEDTFIGTLYSILSFEFSKPSCSWVEKLLI